MVFNLIRTIVTIIKVKCSHLTFLGYRALFDLAFFIMYYDFIKIKGKIIEVGAALGGSSIVIASAKKRNRDFMIYDTFEGIPPPTDVDGADAHKRYENITAGKAKGLGNQLYYGYQDDLLDQLRKRFQKFGLPVYENNIYLIKGYVEKTLNLDEPVAMAHIDCDWYSPVKVSLERIEPFLVTGGRFIIDDYNHWSGARRAVGEFIKEHKNYRVENHARVHLVKVREDN